MLYSYPRVEYAKDFVSLYQFWRDFVLFSFGRAGSERNFPIPISRFALKTQDSVRSVHSQII